MWVCTRGREIDLVRALCHAPRVTTPNRRKTLVRGAKALVSIVLLAVVLRGIASREGLDALGTRIAGLDLTLVLAAIASQLVAMLLAVVRWQLLLRSQGVALPYPRLLKSFLVGRFVGAFAPSTAGLDVYRAVDIGRTIGDQARSASVIFLEKCFGLLGLVWVTILLTPFGVRDFFGDEGIVLAVLVGFGATLGVVVIRRPELFAPIVTRLPKRLGGKIASLLERVRALPISRSVAASALVLGIITHFMTAAVYAAAGVALHVDATPGELLIVGNAIVLATLLPISLGGVGVREGTAVVLLGSIGVPMSEAVLVALLGYLATQPSALVGGLISAMGGGEGGAAHEGGTRAGTDTDAGNDARVISGSTRSRVIVSSACERVRQP
jgi:uncharacterized protein (TIRG00374 family)